MWLLFQLLNLLAKTRQKLLESGAGENFFNVTHSGILFDPGFFLHAFGREKLHVALKSIVKAMFELFIQLWVCVHIDFFLFYRLGCEKQRSFEQKHNKLMSSQLFPNCWLY